MSKVIDCKNMSCPLPVVNTKKYFDNIESGEAIVIVDNEIARNNIIKFAVKQRLACEMNKSSGSSYELKLTKGYEEISEVLNKEEKQVKENLSVEENKLPNSEKFAIVIGSDKMGEGNDDLGKILMKSYLFALSESEIIPSHLIFLNSGVYLTEKNSNTINSINKLIQRGVEIIICGTCIEFYNIKDNIEVGEISNMYSIVEIMNESDKVLKI
ncbi:sulfurtransferase-like selenium metabolism protein YedF [Clostridium sediminicola]|uniref:sulfurtransferase-like selenium metabolism protein YedF n=1 Tax=Clostridium sediminicola TaxID=3114879 RepID=UPI0031F22E33